MDATLQNEGDQLKEDPLGVEVFGRSDTYDPRIDPVVRVEARRLRYKLKEYYATEGRDDAIEIDLPKGGYVPVFREKTPSQDAVPKATGAPRFALWLARQAIVVAALALFAGLDIYHWTTARSGGIRYSSIAVLPLENLSADPEQEYFSDGMTDALITDLAKIRSLRVISRTSVMTYKKTRNSLPEVAQKLGVDYVVEGTVQRARERVRITAQLIAAANIWTTRPRTRTGTSSTSCDALCSCNAAIPESSALTRFFHQNFAGRGSATRMSCCSPWRGIFTRLSRLRILMRAIPGPR